MLWYFHFIISVFPTTKGALSLTAGAIYMAPFTALSLQGCELTVLNLSAVTAFCILLYSSTNCHHSRTAMRKFEANSCLERDVITRDSVSEGHRC